VKRDEKYGIIPSWIVIRYGQYGRNPSSILKRFGKYRIKLWNDMTGKVPFEYFDFKFCTTKCLKEHRQKSMKSWRVYIIGTLFCLRKCVWLHRRIWSVTFFSSNSHTALYL
jgi:hypothetical protein